MALTAMAGFSGLVAGDLLAARACTHEHHAALRLTGLLGARNVRPTTGPSGEPALTGECDRCPSTLMVAIDDSEVA